MILLDTEDATGWGYSGNFPTQDCRKNKRLRDWVK